jgi:hypothetical protein
LWTMSVYDHLWRIRAATEGATPPTAVGGPSVLAAQNVALVDYTDVTTNAARQFLTAHPLCKLK